MTSDLRMFLHELRGLVYRVLQLGQQRLQKRRFGRHAVLSGLLRVARRCRVIQRGDAADQT